MSERHESNRASSVPLAAVALFLFGLLITAYVTVSTFSFKPTDVATFESRIHEPYMQLGQLAMGAGFVLVVLSLCLRTVYVDKPRASKIVWIAVICTCVLSTAQAAVRSDRIAHPDDSLANTQLAIAPDNRFVPIGSGSTIGDWSAVPKSYRVYGFNGTSDEMCAGVETVSRQLSPPNFSKHRSTCSGYGARAAFSVTVRGEVATRGFIVPIQDHVAVSNADLARFQWIVIVTVSAV